MALPVCGELNGGIMDFNWVKSIITNSLFYAGFLTVFYVLFNKFKSKTEHIANAYTFIYSVLVNIICFGIVMILSNPNIDENTWSFMLFSVPAITALPMTIFGLAAVPLLIMIMMPLVLLFHVIKIDIYIGAIGAAFATALLVSGCFQYYILGWGVKHSFKALKEKIKANSKMIIAGILIMVVLSAIGYMSWLKMRNMLDAVYLDKRQEIEYW